MSGRRAHSACCCRFCAACSAACFHCLVPQSAPWPFVSVCGTLIVIIVGTTVLMVKAPQLLYSARTRRRTFPEERFGGTSLNLHASKLGTLGAAGFNALGALGAGTMRSRANSILRPW